MSAGSSFTADVGARVLRDGGNAVDAVVAAAFTSAVVEPGVSSMGGGGFLLVRTPAGDARLLDFFTAVPSGPVDDIETVTVQYAGTTQDFHAGKATVAVPGCIDGFLLAHRLWGSWPLADLVAPAVALAKDGFRLEPGQAHAMALIEPVLMFTPQIRARTAPDGRLLGAGEFYRDVELAAFLAAIAEGRITGIRDLAGAFAELDGPVTGSDLEAFTVVDREPLRTDIGAGRITTNPLPSLGGSIVAHVLADLAQDPDPQPVAIAEALVETTAWLKAQVAGPVATTGTTHISVIDADGMCAALTLSNGLGSGVMLPGTGVHLNNMMGEEDLHPAGAQAAVPGERIRSMMAPSIVEFGDSMLALGSGGSERIRSALTRVITLVLTGEMPLSEAVDTPRVHVDNRGLIQVEPGLAGEQLDALRAKGEVVVWPDRHFYFGGVNAVLRTPTGLQAHSDPRRGGSAVVL